MLRCIHAPTVGDEESIADEIRAQSLRVTFQQSAVPQLLTARHAFALETGIKKDRMAT